MDWSLEVVVLPVRDIDRSIAFYRDQVGFHLDHDTHNEHMHVTQLTPPGSGCSVVFGDLPPQRAMEPGSMKNLQLVVPDATAARNELLDRGVQVSELTVMTHADGGTFFGFEDPDGNSWAVQEIKARAGKPLIPNDHVGLSEWAGVEQMTCRCTCVGAAVVSCWAARPDPEPDARARDHSPSRAHVH